jgi:hypothetical protein
LNTASNNHSKQANKQCLRHSPRTQTSCQHYTTEIQKLRSRRGSQCVSDGEGDGYATTTTTNSSSSRRRLEPSRKTRGDKSTKRALELQTLRERKKERKQARKIEAAGN